MKKLLVTIALVSFCFSANAQFGASFGYGSGKAKISPNGYADRIINYGDSICDCNFDVTINGTTYPIVVN